LERGVDTLFRSTEAGSGAPLARVAPRILAAMKRTCITGTLLALVLASGGCTQLERPDVLVTNLTPLESTMLEYRMEIALRILNPNDQEIAVRGLDLRLNVNDRTLARGVAGEPFVVPALGEAETTINASTTVLDVWRQIAAMSGAQGQTGVDYELTGKIHLEGGFPGSIPIKSEGRIDLEDFGAPTTVPELTAPIQPD